MGIPYEHLQYMWNQVILPRVGDVYVFGGSLSPDAVQQGTDCLVEGTLVTTSRGEVPIEQLTAEDWVLTRQGYRRVLRAWKVREDATIVSLHIGDRTLRGTPDHRVWTENRGWVGLASVEDTDTLVSCQELSESSFEDSPIAATPTLIDRRPVLTFSASQRKEMAQRHYIERSGFTTMVRSLRDMKSTMSTTTPSTMTPPILIVLRSPSTAEKAKHRDLCTIMSAPSAESNSRRVAHPLVRIGFAAASTKTNTGTTSVENRPVYDVSVEGVHEFFANGVLVHNCTGAGSEVNEALLFGPAMNWQRQFWTGTFAGVAPGDHGPFGGALSTVDWVCIASPHDAPPDAAAIFSVLQLTDPTQAHMVCAAPALDGSGLVGIEAGGSYTDANGNSTLHISPNATSIYDPMWNQFFYLPGPITGWPDGITPTFKEPPTTMAFQNNVTDTLFADVSEFQAPVDNSYTDAGYRVLSIRANDGTYDDHKFAQNYAWCVQAANDGRLEFFIVYCYWHPDTAITTLIQQVQAAGGLHPRMVVMIDLESGGNANVDQSQALNADYQTLVNWVGDQKRVIAYANIGDEQTMWQAKPANLGWILAGYGSNPSDPSLIKLAHQYTDGAVGAGGLPSGAPPFGNCDMNSADGLSVEAFAAAVGLGAPLPPPPPPPGVPVPSDEPNQNLSDTDAIHAILWKNTFLLDLTDRPRSPGDKDDLYGHLISLRAEQLITQALLTALCESAKIDTAAVIAAARAALTPKETS